MDVVLALSALAEFVAFQVLALAREWIRFASRPDDARGFALVRAIWATVGTVAADVLIAILPGFPISTWFQIFHAFALFPPYYVVLGLLVLVEGVRVWLGLRQLRRGRAERRAKAHAARNPTWPFGSDRPEST